MSKIDQEIDNGTHVGLWKRFHELWEHAKGSPEYNRDEWTKFCELLSVVTTEHSEMQGQLFRISEMHNI